MSKEQYIEFPEEYTRRELNARYREIPLKDTTSRLLRKYFNAMANLYGIIPLHKAKEIIFSLSPKLVTEDEFLAFAEIARHECEDYYILGGDELYTNAGHCTCGGGCLHGLRRADLQGGEEETQQKGVGSHRGCGICGRDSGGHSDRPDTDAALIGRRIE